MSTLASVVVRLRAKQPYEAPVEEKGERKVGELGEIERGKRAVSVRQAWRSLLHQKPLEIARGL